MLVSTRALKVRMDPPPDLGSEVEVELDCDGERVVTRAIVEAHREDGVLLRFPRLDPESLVALLGYTNRRAE
jgi:hypothetical protein